jgi:3-oxoacyl-[acyl-carrier protein] reductase
MPGHILRTSGNHWCNPCLCPVTVLAVVTAPDGVSAARVVIVTGGSRGLGRETTDRLARLGYAVVVSYADDQREAESTVEAVLDGNGTAVAVRADVDDDLDVERLFAETIELFGAIDAVVHAVRGRVAGTPVGEVGLDEFDAVFRTHTRAAFVVNRHAARHVRTGGVIVNLSTSVAGSVLPRYGVNVAAAAAVDALTRVLALELRERDIAVNAVTLDVESPQTNARVADVIAYLLSDKGHGHTGHVIDLDDWSPPGSGPWTGDGHPNSGPGRPT